MKNKIKLFPFLVFLLPLFNYIFNKFDYKTQDLSNVSLGLLKKGHILGTDYLGRDLLARVS